MRKGSRGGDPYIGYYAGGSAGVIGESNTDNRLPRKELVLGLGFDGEPVAFPYSQLKAQQVVHTENYSSPTVVYFDPATDTALAYGSVVDGQELSFELIEQDGRQWFQDEQTGSLWIPFTGQLVRGELAGFALVRLHAVNVFWFARNDFYPDTSVWGLSYPF